MKPGATGATVKFAVSVVVLALLAATGFAQSGVVQNASGILTATGGAIGTCYPTQSVAGTCVVIPNFNGAFSATFEEVPSGSPTGVSILIYGCMRGGTCSSVADTNTSTSSANRSVTFTTPYDVFVVVSQTLTGGTSPQETINLKASTANSHSGSGTITGSSPIVVTGSNVTCPTCGIGSSAAVHTVSVNEGASVALGGAGPGTLNQILASAGSSADPVYKSWADLDSTQYVAGGGTAQVQTATLAPPATAMVNGLEINFLPVANNTGAAPTLAVNGLTAKPITKAPNNSALVANDLTTTTIASVIYDGTEWQLQNPQASLSAVLAGGGITVTNGTGPSATVALTLGGSSGAIIYDNGAGGLGEVASPTVNGFYPCGFNVTANVGVNPTCSLQGVPIEATNPATALYSDRLNYFNWSSGATLTLPAIAGTFASNFSFALENTSSGTLAITPTTPNNIDGGSSQAASSLLKAWFALVYSDSTNWKSVKLPTFAAFSGFTGIIQNAAGVFSAATAHNISAALVCAAASASGTAYACSTSPTFTPADGDFIMFQADVASGAAPTLVVNGQAGGPLIKKNGGVTSLGANDLVAGEDALMQFDGTNWQLQPPPLAVLSATALMTSPAYQASLNSTAVTVSSGIGATNANGLAPPLLLNGEDVTGTGSASVGGLSILRGGIVSNATPNAASLAGPAQIAAGAFKGTAIANVGDVVCSTTTAETVTDCPLGANNVVGIATTTTAPVTYVSNGVTVVKTDNATTIGDVICGPSVTAGLAHDNGTSPCPPGTYIGTVVANAGTNAVNIAAGLTTASATPASTLPLVQLAIGTSGIGQLSKVSAASQTAAISTATLCTAAACSVSGAQYNLHFNLWGSGTACSSVTAGSLTFLLTWTDENAVTHSAVALQMMGQTGAATEAMGGTFPFQTALANESASGDFKFSTNGTIIQYATGYTACTTGTGTYNLRASVTRVQ